MAAEMKANIVYGAKGVDAVSAAAGKVQHDLEKVSKSAGRLNGAFRGMRGGAAQFGYQIQDVAVQLQSGQNALLVFGQQGSQIASIMGPGGALIGAFIAVSAAIGSALLPSLFDAEDGLYDIAAALDEVKKKQGELSNAIRAELIKQQTAEIEKLERQLQGERDAIESNNKSAQRYNYNLDLLTNQYGNLGANVQQGAAFNMQFAQSSEEAADNNITNASSIELLEKRLSEAREELEKLKAGENPFVEPNKDVESLRKKTESFIASLEEQAVTYGLNKAETLAYQAAQLDLDETQRASVKQYLQGLEAQIEAERILQEEKKRTSAAEKLKSKLGGVDMALMNPFQQLEEQANQMKTVVAESLAAGVIDFEGYKTRIEAIHAGLAHNLKATQFQIVGATLGMFQQSVSQMSAMMDQGSAIGKAFYVMSQAMAAGQAIISGYVASMNIVKNMTALGMDPGTAAMMGQMAVGMGYATAGMIMGQTAASFEGGGITFNGVRSGGLDGKGGRMAMVHPNEKITDLEKGGAGSQAPVNVSFNISAVDAKGIDELLIQRRAMITNLVNKAINNRGRSSLA